MTEAQRAALEAEAALARFLLTNGGLWDDEKRTVRAALDIVRAKAAEK